MLAICRITVILVMALCCVATAQPPASQTPTSSSGVAKATVAPKCLFVLPTANVAQAEYQAVDTPTNSQDGFVDAFQAISDPNRLAFTFRCNGVGARIKFRHPQKVSGPALALGTFYETNFVTQSGDTGGFSSASLSNSAIVGIDSSFERQRIYFSSIIYNGGVNRNTGRIPLIAGQYEFRFQADIEANN